MIMNVEITDNYSPLLKAISARASDLAGPIGRALAEEKALAQQARDAGIPPPVSQTTIQIRERVPNTKRGEVKAALDAAEPTVTPTTGELAVLGPGPAVQQKGIVEGRMVIFGRQAPKSHLPSRPFLFWHVDRLPEYDRMTLDFVTGNA